MMSIFEIVMLSCFGMSWPFSIWKSIKTRNVSGKSPAFLMIILAGYASGILHKVFYSMDWVILLYIANLLMVAFDLLLYYRYSNSGMMIPTDNRDSSLGGLLK